MTLQELEKQLYKADWFYMMSDDHSVYLAGRNNLERLWKTASAFGKEGQALFNRIQKECTRSC